MAKFRASDVTPISWDLQGMPKMDPETQKINGKWQNGEPLATGTIPEPDPDQIQAYLEAFVDLVQALTQTGDDVPAEFYAEQRATATVVLVDLGFPEEMLAQLPPRYFRSLMDHVYGELQGEAQSAG